MGKRIQWGSHYLINQKSKGRGYSIGLRVKVPDELLIIDGAKCKV